jgi:hypothetical protein
MGKTLATILTGLFLATASSSCTPEGRSLALGLMTHATREKISHELNPNQTNVNVYNQQNLSENVIERDGKYLPAPGYKWMNPKNPKDFRVIKIPNWDEYMCKNSEFPPSFTCLNVKDIDKNGAISKNEVIGLGKNYFECKNPNKATRVMAGVNWENVKGKTASYVVKETKTGKILGVLSNKAPYKTEGMLSFAYWNFRKKENHEGIRSYTIEYFLDGKKIPTRTIEFFVNYGKKETIEEDKKENE